MYWRVVVVVVASSGNCWRSLMIVTQVFILAITIIAIVVKDVIFPATAAMAMVVIRVIWTAWILIHAVCLINP